MTEASTGVSNGKGWRAHKYYLSPEAQALLEAHCKGTPLTMSAYLDMLIKRELTPPAPYVPSELAAVKPDMFDAYVNALITGKVANEPVQITEDHVAAERERRAENRPAPDKKDFKLDV